MKPVTRFQTLLALAVCWLCAGGLAVRAQEDEQPRPTLAVVPFELSVDDRERIQGRGLLLSDRLTASLVRSGQFRVLERVVVQRLLDEQKIASGSRLEGTSAVEIGRLLGARWLVTGTISEHQVSSRTIPIPNTNHVSRRTLAQVAVDWRVVDATSGEVVVAERERVDRKWSGLSAPEKPSAQDMDGLYGELADRLVGRLSEFLAPGATPVARAGERAPREPVLRDQTPPVLLVVEPSEEGSVSGSRVRVVLEASDAGGVERVEVLGVTAARRGENRYVVDVLLAEGANRIDASARDRAGNVTQITLDVRRDSTAPALTVIEPADGSRVSPGSVVVRVRVRDRDVSWVRVNDQPASAVAGSDGIWEARVDLAAGEPWIVARASDAVGNVGAARIQVAVSGSGPGLQVAVRVKVAGEVEAEGTAVTVNGMAVAVAADGRFEVEIDLPPDGVVRVRATDRFGNVTERVMDYAR